MRAPAGRTGRATRAAASPRPTMLVLRAPPRGRTPGQRAARAAGRRARAGAAARSRSCPCPRASPAPAAARPAAAAAAAMASRMGRGGAWRAPRSTSACWPARSARAAWAACRRRRAPGRARRVSAHAPPAALPTCPQARAPPCSLRPQSPVTRRCPGTPRIVRAVLLELEDAAGRGGAQLHAPCVQAADPMICTAHCCRKSSRGRGRDRLRQNNRRCRAAAAQKAS